MINSKLQAIALVLSASLLVTGCAHYQSMALNHDQLDFAAYVCEQRDISVSAKVFDIRDCKYYLGRNTIKEGFQPIQITIRNNSNDYLLLSPEQISLPIVDPQIVADSVHTSTVGRAVGYSIGGLFIWPLLIPAVVDGMGSHKANKALDMDYATKAIQQKVIPPHTTMSGIIFVPTYYYHPNFDLTLITKERKEPLQFNLSAY